VTPAAIVSTYTKASLLAARAMSLYGVAITAGPPDTRESAVTEPIDTHAPFAVPSHAPPKLNRAQRRAAARRR